MPLQDCFRSTGVGDLHDGAEAKSGSAAEPDLVLGARERAVEMQGSRFESVGHTSTVLSVVPATLATRLVFRGEDFLFCVEVNEGAFSAQKIACRC